MSAPVSCTLGDGSKLAGRLSFRATFPALGFRGGSTTGAGSIAWDDGRSTRVQGSVAVSTTAVADNYGVVMDLSFPSGFGATGSASMTLTVFAGFDPATNRVVSIQSMNGSFAWQH